MQLRTCYIHHAQPAPRHNTIHYCQTTSPFALKRNLLVNRFIFSTDYFDRTLKRLGKISCSKLNFDSLITLQTFLWTHNFLCVFSRINNNVVNFIRTYVIFRASKLKHLIRTRLEHDILTLLIKSYSWII